MKEKEKKLTLEEKIKLLPREDKDYISGYIDRALKDLKQKIKTA